MVLMLGKTKHLTHVKQWLRDAHCMLTSSLCIQHSWNNGKSWKMFFKHLTQVNRALPAALLYGRGQISSLSLVLGQMSHSLIKNAFIFSFLYLYSYPNRIKECRLCLYLTKTCKILERKSVDSTIYWHHLCSLPAHMIQHVFLIIDNHMIRITR